MNIPSFWQTSPQPFFILAPMEAVTDVVFRHVVMQAAAPDMCMTEFTNATGWAHAGDKAIGGRLVKTDDESPLIAQLWGAVPDAMKQLATHCAELGFAGIGINMGCPDVSATKSGGGAGMIRTPELAGQMIKAAKASGLPVSVKTRLGYTYQSEWRDWLEYLLHQDIVNLTIHLRTRKEMSKVPAHFELIDEIVALRDEIAPHTLLTINGDIRDRAEGLELVRQHPGVNGVMIGRGVFRNPYCFKKEVANSDKPAHQADLINLLRYHLDLYDQYHEQTGRPYETLKRFYKVYIRDFEGASELRDRLMHTKSTDEVRAILDAL